MNTGFKVRMATSQDERRWYAVRHRVFVIGQEVPWEEDFDGLDPECGHFLAEDLQGEPIGAARLRVTDSGLPKAERVAVLESWRGRGVGRALMEALEASAFQQGHATMSLNAQIDVIPFYERLDYVVEGPVFYEADIPHRRMEKGLG